MEYLQPLYNTAALAAIFLGGLASLIVFFNRLTRLEVKVDTMWSFLWKRALSEALSTGAATHNSPIEVTETAKQWMSPLIPDIRDFCRKPPPKDTMTNQDLALEIERQFGQRIMDEVCIPHGLHMGACLVVAVDAVREHQVGLNQGFSRS